MWAQTLAIDFSSMLLPHHDSQGHKCLHCSLILGCVGEYFQATRTFSPFTLAPMSFDTTLVLTTLHPKLNGYFPLFLKDYELNQDFEFFFFFFKLTFQRMSHLLASGPSKIFLTHSRLFSPRRFNEWIPLVVLTLLSYCTRSHFFSNCT